jgi:hypothetical protein
MNCFDCGWCDDYIVVDEVWAIAGLKPDDHCCLACLERRLKRQLTLADFQPFPINRQAYAAAGKLSVVLEAERRQQELQALFLDHAAEFERHYPQFSISEFMRRHPWEDSNGEREPTQEEIKTWEIWVKKYNEVRDRFLGQYLPA